MIDFENAAYGCYTALSYPAISNDIDPLLVENEQILKCFAHKTHYYVFTDKRIIITNIVEQLIGKDYKTYNFIPYSSIELFNMYTHSISVYVYNLGKVSFSFSNEQDITEMERLFAHFILK